MLKYYKVDIIMHRHSYYLNLCARTDVKSEIYNYS
jgi:hypothetical protein